MPNKPTTNYVDSRTDTEREADSKIEVTVTTATASAKPTTLREEEVLRPRPFEPKNKKLFEILKSLASTGNGDKYDPISAYKEIDRILTSHNTELVSKIEGMKSESTSINQAVYNRAMDEVISIINQEK